MQVKPFSLVCGADAMGFIEVIILSARITLLSIISDSNDLIYDV